MERNKKLNISNSLNYIDSIVLKYESFGISITKIFFSAMLTAWITDNRINGLLLTDISCPVLPIRLLFFF